MKSAAFADHLNEFAALLDAAHSTSLAKNLRSVSEIFRELPNKSVSDVVSRLEGRLPKPAMGSDSSVTDLSLLLERLETFTQKLGSKSASADMQIVRKLLDSYRDTALDCFISTAKTNLSKSVRKPAKEKKSERSDLVEMYNRKLEEALGDDDGFRYIFAQLERDPLMGASELAALAKRFALAAPKNKDQSLKKIFARHQALMIARAASQATAGRIAG